MKKILLLVPKLPLGNTLVARLSLAMLAASKRGNTCSFLTSCEAELRERAFPSRSLGTRERR
jgi:hypothetical protein